MSPQTNQTTRKTPYIKYIFSHCIPRGFNNIKHAIIIWYKLIREDYSDYRIYRVCDESELFQMLRYEFYDLLEDDTLDIQTYDVIMQRAYEVQIGQVELIPWESIDIEEITSK